MQSFTNKDKKKYEIILFLKRVNCCKKYIFSQTKTYFCYINIVFEVSCKVVFLVFGILTIKYLPFRTPNASTLILGWLRLFIFYFVFVKFFSWVVGLS